jgi:hypothetical protein
MIPPEFVSNQEHDRDWFELDFGWKTNNIPPAEEFLQSALSMTFLA